MTSAMASTTRTVPKGQERKSSIESTMHRLKLEWIMAKDESEKRKASDEIRRQIQQNKPTKNP